MRSFVFILVFCYSIFCTTSSRSITESGMAKKGEVAFSSLLFAKASDSNIVADASVSNHQKITGKFRKFRFKSIQSFCPCLSVPDYVLIYRNHFNSYEWLHSFFLPDSASCHLGTRAPPSIV